LRPGKRTGGKKRRREATEIIIWKRRGKKKKGADTIEEWEKITVRCQLWEEVKLLTFYRCRNQKLTAAGRMQNEDYLLEGGTQGVTSKGDRPFRGGLSSRKKRGDSLRT